MKIVYNPGGEYNDCIVKYFDLQDYEHYVNDDVVIFWGWDSLFNEKEKEKYKDYSKKYFINTAQPCEIINGYGDIQRQEFFDKVFTICPYTPDIINRDVPKFEPICFPYNYKYFEKYEKIQPTDKTHTVMYYGQIHDQIYVDLLKTLSKFNHKICSHTSDTFSKYGVKNKLTDIGLTTTQKWDLISKCKITVGFNLIFINQNHIENLKKLDKIHSFKEIDKVIEKKIMPQMKTRMVEAALTKTLMLIYKDDWNVIENWFEPNVDFLYWENFEQLEKLIIEVENNFENYWEIIENAHKKVRQYSIDKLLNKLKNEI